MRVQQWCFTLLKHSSFKRPQVVCFLSRACCIHVCLSLLFQGVWILSVCVILSEKRLQSNEEGVFCLYLPRLRHQAHKELYAYKQVSAPSDKHTCTVRLSTWKTHVMYWVGCCASILKNLPFVFWKLHDQVVFAKYQGVLKGVSDLPATVHLKNPELREWNT